MKFKSKLAERGYTIFFMFIIAVFCLSILTWVYLTSKSTIEFNESLASKRALLLAAELDSPADPQELNEFFTARVSRHTNQAGDEVYLVYQAPLLETNQIPALQGFVFDTRGVGLWGEIRAWVGLAPDQRHLLSLAITAQSETPGLGARIDEPWFGAQFSGKTGPLEARPEKTRSTNETQFDGLTGATATTHGIKEMLNSLLANAPQGIARLARTDRRLAKVLTLQQTQKKDLNEQDFKFDLENISDKGGEE